MRRKLLEFIACQHCQGSLAVESIARELDESILTGRLICNRWGTLSLIDSGIPIFLDRMDHESHVAERFGFEWQLHHDRGFEKDKVFGCSLDDDISYFLDAFGLNVADMKGKLILDAGCGSGTLTAELARRFPECTVIGIDFNPSIREIVIRHGALPNLSIIRASVLKMPIKRGVIDLAWSHGVIHHTGNTRGAFNEITAVVRPLGMAYI